MNQSETAFDFGFGPMPAHRHANGGGWVADTANVAATAYIGPNAQVFDRAQVFDQAQVFDRARVSDRAQVFGTARVFGAAQVFGTARVSPLFISGDFEYSVTAADDTLQVGCKRLTAADLLTPDLFPQETCPKLRAAAPELIVAVLAHWRRCAAAKETSNMGDMADYYASVHYELDMVPPANRPDWRRDVRQDEWVSGDGARVKITDMTDAHLFFSLAKGYRGEYGPRSVAASRMPSLEAEAKRRLRAKTKGQKK